MPILRNAPQPDDTFTYDQLAAVLHRPVVGVRLFAAQHGLGQGRQGPANRTYLSITDAAQVADHYGIDLYKQLKLPRATPEEVFEALSPVVDMTEEVLHPHSHPIRGEAEVLYPGAVEVSAVPADMVNVVGIDPEASTELTGEKLVSLAKEILGSTPKEVTEMDSPSLSDQIDEKQLELDEAFDQYKKLYRELTELKIQQLEQFK